MLDAANGLTAATDAAKDAARRIQEARERRTAPLILELDLTEGLLEAPPADPLTTALSQRKPRLQDILDGLRRARSDEQVKALIVKIGNASLSLAAAQELRGAVAALRDAGKATVAWSESFGEFSPGTIPYYLATGFEQVWLQPSGDVCLTGVAIEAQFVKGALDKAGITPQLGKRHEYKNAVNTLTESGFTEPHREAQQRLVESTFEQVVDGIAAGRGLDTARVRELVDHAPILGTEALEAGLVDHLGYRDEAYAALRERVGERAWTRYVARYQRARTMARQLPRHHEHGIALVHGVGPIMAGRSKRSPVQGQSMGSDTISAALRAAARDDRVRAIVFRINSPGGSYVASDTIWREVVLARRSGKPVIVSMGEFAASGGYFVSMAADTIVAQPGTLTGSIGVFGGKAVVSDLLGKVGISQDGVAAGEHARMFTPARRFDDTEWERVNTWLDRIYDDFTTKAAQGRDLSRERVHELARGRVWTGADARERGLVDELGGIEQAIEMARSRAGIPQGADVEVRHYPRTSPLDRLRPPESSDDRTAAQAGVEFSAWGTLAGAAQRLGLPAEGPLVLPGAWRIR